MLTKRIIKMFFSSKEYVFAMMINVAVVLALFVMFLGEQAANNIQFLLDFEVTGIDSIVVGVVFGGLLSIIGISACMGALQIIVEDWDKAAKDFHVSPISRAGISRGYLGGSMIIGFFTSFVGIVLCLAYMGVVGGGTPSVETIGKLLLTAALSATATTTFIYFLIVCMNSPQKFHSFAGIFGTLIGFLMGVYVPIVVFPAPLQWLVMIFPLSHTASMYRSALADNQLAALFQYAEPGNLEMFRTTFGLAYDYGPFMSTFWMSAAVLVVSTVLFYVLSVIIVKRRVTHQ
jgi:multidrug/hemolysin transport system permease protein